MPLGARSSGTTESGHGVGRLRGVRCACVESSRAEVVNCVRPRPLNVGLAGPMSECCESGAVARVVAGETAVAAWVHHLAGVVDVRKTDQVPELVEHDDLLCGQAVAGCTERGHLLRVEVERAGDVSAVAAGRRLSRSSWNLRWRSPA